MPKPTLTHIISHMLTDVETEKIAGLIKIKIPKEELPNYTSQLNTVLKAADVLQELDTKNVVPTAQTHGLENVLREDEPKPGLDMQKYPNSQFNKTISAFEVQQVVGGGE